MSSFRLQVLFCSCWRVQAPNQQISLPFILACEGEVLGFFHLQKRLFVFLDHHGLLLCNFV